MNMGIERVSTGIPELDKLIEGGIPKNFANVFYGRPGTHNSMFARVFACEGLVKGENVLYITYDRPPELLVTIMKDILTARGRSEGQIERDLGNLTIIDCWSWRRMTEEGSPVDRAIYVKNPIDTQQVFNKVKEYALSHEEGGRAVLESLTGLTSLTYGETAREISEMFKILKGFLRNQNFTQVYVLYAGAYKNTVVPLLYSMDGIFRTRRRLEGSKYRFFLSIERLFATNHPVELIEFIPSKSGIKLLTAV